MKNILIAAALFAAAFFGVGYAPPAIIAITTVILAVALFCCGVAALSAAFTAKIASRLSEVEAEKVLNRPGGAWDTMMVILLAARASFAILLGGLAGWIGGTAALAVTGVVMVFLTWLLTLPPREASAK